jgi:hypothetical protein
MGKILASVLGLTVLVVASALLMTLPVYFLWNALMPEIFGLTTLTFWQALGVSLLSACLFGRSSGSSS